MVVEKMDAGRRSMSDGRPQNPNTQAASEEMMVHELAVDGKEAKAANLSQVSKRAVVGW